MGCWLSSAHAYRITYADARYTLTDSHIKQEFHAASGQGEWLSGNEYPIQKNVTALVPPFGLYCRYRIIEGHPLSCLVGDAETENRLFAVVETYDYDKEGNAKNPHTILVTLEETDTYPLRVKMRFDHQTRQLTADPNCQIEKFKAWIKLLNQDLNWSRHSRKVHDSKMPQSVPNYAQAKAV
jgi:hypothetical protein